MCTQTQVTPNRVPKTHDADHCHVELMNKDNSIYCSQHDESSAAYICEHLVANPAQRWCCDYPSEDTQCPDAWCEQCDAEFQKEGEWNERNEGSAKIKVVCKDCYEAGISASVEFLEQETYNSWSATVAECHSELRTKQELLETQYSISRHKRWDYDQETGLLVFSNDGVPAVISDIEIVGSLSSLSDTWLWSWANFHLLANVRNRIEAVRTFGESNGFPRLTVPKWKADQYLGWEVSAIATQVLEAKGVYRVPTGKGFLFMAMTDIRYAT